MIKPFILIFIFVNLFVILNTIGDAINFYRVFKYYKNMKLWHTLKYGWMFCAVAAGYFLNDLIHAAPQNSDRYVFILFFIAWFCFLRLILHETLMAKWRKEK